MANQTDLLSTGAPNDELRGKTAIVTGGASGIGAATAARLAAAGVRVAILDRDVEAATDLARKLDPENETAFAVAVDLANPEEISAAVRAVLDRCGRIDILVNNAGITGATSALLELSREDWDTVYAVNVRAPFLLIQQVGRHMVAAGGGRIVNVSSSSAYRALQSAPAYGSSKAALSQLTRSAAAELGPHGINVNAVAPGLTATPLVARALGDDVDDLVRAGPLANLVQRVSQPEDVAAVIVFLCTEASRQITAQTLHVSAGAIV